jgi:hypothetical protein
MVHQTVYNKLTEVAGRRDTINYGAVAPLAGIDVNNPNFAALLAPILDEINCAEHAADRPLLSAVVIGLESNQPGPGFFRCARSLGLLDGGHDEQAFWIAELNRVHEYWEPRWRTRWTR